MEKRVAVICDLLARVAVRLRSCLQSSLRATFFFLGTIFFGRIGERRQTFGFCGIVLATSLRSPSRSKMAARSAALPLSPRCAPTEWNALPARRATTPCNVAAIADRASRLAGQSQVAPPLVCTRRRRAREVFEARGRRFRTYIQIVFSN